MAARRGRIRSRVLVKRSEAPDYFATTVSANGHGDLAVLLNPDPGHGDRAQLLRKRAGEPWKRTLTIGANRYDSVLESVDIVPSGAVVGAFKHDQALSVRTSWLMSPVRAALCERATTRSAVPRR
ncbi:MAG: hypothetical protein WKF73_12325 [Nocardioidaceae bacterium]